jgi:hypothetical protein
MYALNLGFSSIIVNDIMNEPFLSLSLSTITLEQKLSVDIRKDSKNSMLNHFIAMDMKYNYMASRTILSSLLLLFLPFYSATQYQTLQKGNAIDGEASSDHSGYSISMPPLARICNPCPLLF